MKRNLIPLGMAVIALLVLGFALQARAATTVSASLDQPQITLGDTAQLTVTVSGAQEQPDAPTVDGLDIQEMSQSTQISVINGALTMSATKTYAISPRREGTFVIPAIKVGDATSQPLTLHVVRDSATASSTLPAPALSGPTSPAQNPPATSNGPVVLPPLNPTPGTSNAGNEPSPEGRFGSIVVVLPKKEIYVGELVPVDIKVYIPDDLQASITDLPQLTSDGFTLNQLGTKPEKSTEAANGRGYAVFTWHSALTGVKMGDYPIDLSMPMTVVVPQPMPQGDPDDLMNSFFRNAFASMGTKKDVTIHNQTLTLKVLPLPQNGRPADFSGAVGQFEIETSASPTTVNAGDPITLRLKITGTGNFDRVSSDMLAADAHWKTYSTKNHFDPADVVGYQGTKTFEQPIIPNDSSVTSVPGISFSYFNPETRQYVTRTAAPIAVTVSGSAAPAPSVSVASSPTPGPVIQPASATPVTGANVSDLRANKLDPGAFVASLQPVYLNPWFVAGQGLPLVALLGGLALIRRQKQVSHPERVRATAIQQAIRQQIDAMDEAMRNHQTDAFFIHARSALQQRLGHQWNMRPETITLADVEARISDGLDTIRPVFEMADQAKYSDLHFEDADLRQWREAVVNELAEKN